MSSVPDIVDVLKIAAQKAIDSGYPADWITGIVESINPLTIRTEQQELLPEGFLWLTDAVRDYEVDITVNHLTEVAAGGSGMAEYAPHVHGYKGRKKIIVHNRLTVGEKVFLVQKQGGQAFIVLGRIEQHKNLSGQWI